MPDRSAAAAALVRCLALAALVLGLAAPARSFEAFDGRVQLHGFYEAQIRTIAKDFSPSDNYDLTQFYNILDLELEADLLTDEFGPFSYISAFARIEARYDCVWTHACGISPNVNVYGNKKKQLPGRLTGAQSNGYDGSLFTGDTRKLQDQPISQLGFRYKDEPVNGNAVPAYIWHVPGVSTLFGVPGPDGTVGTQDDPAFYTFARYIRENKEYRWATRRVPGSVNGWDNSFLGPWEPQDKIVPLAALIDRANPFNPSDFNPVTNTFGSAALPYRPSPQGGAGEARGLYIPNAAVAELDRDGKFDAFDQNFSQADLAWNHGASQQQQKELKEAYLDIEMFQSRLWLRLGLQSIVWGKTELFRTTDQFNPQDLALASLPDLEESRIALWAARAVWSFGTIGRIEDLRLEVAANFDQFEPTDLGRCGEPYTPNPVCQKTIGLFAHGAAGFGLAGEHRPPDPWESWKGLEAGVRVEWRTGDFSFALTDFYGYDDYPYIQQVFLYERNVDPRTGRMRRLNSRAGCDPENLFDGDTSGCLDPGNDALVNAASNQQRFAVICSSSVGFNELDRSVCAQSVFNSRALADPTNPASPRVSVALTSIMAGSASASGIFYPQLTGSTVPVLVPLNADPNDGPVAPTQFMPNGALDFNFNLWTPGGLDPVTTPQQRALLGCGPYLGTDCDIQGMDLLNSEMSALLQAWPGFPGTVGDWSTTDSGVSQPGTVGFVGGAVCARYERGQEYVLPGCRGPGDEGYDPAVDGTTTGLVHPFTGQQFKSEMAALSWNFLMELVGLSGLGVPDSERAIDEFISSDPFRSNGCSFEKPQLCSNVQALYAVAHVTRNTLRAGGNGRFGRTDFDWHVGGSGLVRYKKRNVLGFSFDFAEDWTKTNWSVESTWFNNILMEDNDSMNGLREVSTYNVTISVDRPTFVNFLNANRTFFFNTQIFFQYIQGYTKGFPSNGPFNVLGTFTVQTGYFQDRLMPSVTFVYDMNSNSGGVLPELTYRYTEAFSVTVGVNGFFGRWEAAPAATTTVGDPPYRTGRNANNDFVENGLSAIRDRDEIFMRIRYTF